MLKETLAVVLATVAIAGVASPAANAEPPGGDQTKIHHK